MNSASLQFGFSSPCWGECSFTHRNIQGFKEIQGYAEVFVPMFGECSFTIGRLLTVWEFRCFRPHVWGMFFHLKLLTTHTTLSSSSFRPHVWGIFFHYSRNGAFWGFWPNRVFVPMFGECSFTVLNMTVKSLLSTQWFSSPCLGNVLSRKWLHEK